MRPSFTRPATAALIAGLSIALAGCGGDTEAANEAAPNAVDANLMFEEPANDASAMESVANVSEPPPLDTNVSQPIDDTGALGETSGGDTGGNTVESNVAGM